MSLRFMCSGCGKPIVSRFLNPGESAMCRQCGAQTAVPEDATLTDETPEYQTLSEQVRGTLREHRGEPPEPPVIPSVLGPRGIRDLFREVFRVYAARSVTFVVIAAVIEIPTYVVREILQIGLLQSLTADEFMGGGAYRLVWAEYLVVITTALLLVLRSGAYVVVVMNHYASRRLGVICAYRHALSRFGRLLGSSVLFGIIVVIVFAVVIGAVIGFIAVSDSSSVTRTVIYMGFAVSLGLLIIVRWMLFAEPVMLERTGSGASLARSSGLVSGHVLRSFAVLWLVSAQIGVLSMLGSLIPIVDVVIDMLIAPIAPVAATILYFDLRVRKEGYTPEHLVRELDAAWITPGGSPAPPADPFESSPEGPTPPVT